MTPLLLDYMTKLFGVWALVPTGMLLAVSFFVSVVARKTEGGLKIFGQLVAIFLVIAAFLVFSVDIYIMSDGRRLIMQKIVGSPSCPSMK